MSERMRNYRPGSDSEGTQDYALDIDSDPTQDYGPPEAKEFLAEDRRLPPSSDGDPRKRKAFFVVSGRPQPPYKTVLVDVADVAIPKKICAGCGRVCSALRRCTGCRVARYCNHVCLETHWYSGHSVYCKHMKYTRELMAKAMERVTQEVEERLDLLRVEQSVAAE